MTRPPFTRAPKPYTKYAPKSLGMGSRTPSIVADQEAQFQDAPWDGTLAKGLETGRTTRKNRLADILKTSTTQSQNLLDTTLNDLAGGRNEYQTGVSSLISRLGSDLGAGREGFRARSQGQIDADRAARDSEFADFEQAERMGADQAIAQGTRANKALFAKAGSGASSYADRLAAGLRMGAETRLQQNLANRRAANRDAVRAQQLALDNSLFGAERNDLGQIFSGEARLLDTLASQERADEAFQFGAQSDIYDRDVSGQMGLENDDFNLGRADDRFVYGEKQRTLGRRDYLPRSSARRNYAPIYANFAQV